VSFPDIYAFPESATGPYERQMGACIAELLMLFRDRVLDSESNRHVHALAVTPGRWSAGHDVFDEVRRRLLVAQEAGDPRREAQYGFEETCCQAMFNATETNVPFDPSAAFFVAGMAVVLARSVGVPVTEVVAVLAPVGDSA